MSIIDFAALEEREEALEAGKWFRLEGEVWNRYKIKVAHRKGWEEEFKRGLQLHKGPLSKKALNQTIAANTLFFLPAEYLEAGFRRAIKKTGALLALAPVGDGAIEDEPEKDELASPDELLQALRHSHFVNEVARCHRELVDPEAEVEEELSGN